MRISVRVQPRAKKDAITEGADGVWKLHVSAPALEGKANDACVEFLARGLGVSRSKVKLVLGEKSRTKVFDIEGIDEAAFLRFANRGDFR